MYGPEQNKDIMITSLWITAVPLVTSIVLFYLGESIWMFPAVLALLFSFPTIIHTRDHFKNLERRPNGFLDKCPDGSKHTLQMDRPCYRGYWEKCTKCGRMVARLAEDHYLWEERRDEPSYHPSKDSTPTNVISIMRKR